jgi:hypothetical protein
VKDPVKFIKDAYYTLLDGNVTYNATTIPVYDEEAVPAGNTWYIIISTVTNTNNPVKTKFFTDIEILIDVVTLLDYQMTKEKEIVDVICGKIMNLVLPTKETTGIADTSDFQAISVRCESGNHLPVADTGTKKVVRRVLRFSQTIVEN